MVGHYKFRIILKKIRGITPYSQITEQSKVVNRSQIQCLTKKVQICKFQYKTFFNMMSIMPYLGRQILQKSNTKYLLHERLEPRDTSIPHKKPHKRAKKDL